MRWRGPPWASPIYFVIWGHPAASSQPLMDNKPGLQSSLAPCIYLFLFWDTVIITAGVTTFCCVSYKKMSMFPWTTWKFTPFFTASDRPKTALLGLLQRGFRCAEEISGISDCNADCFGRWYWQPWSWWCWDWSTAFLGLLPQQPTQELGNTQGHVSGWCRAPQGKWGSLGKP